MSERAHVHGRATAHLSAADPELAAVIERVGPCRLGLASPGPVGKDGAFAALAEAIVSQQLSVRAADTIFGRVRALGPGGRFPAPDALLALSDASLRGAGLSRAKVAAVRDLAARVHSGELRLAELEGLADDAIIESLTRVRGIGRWTAEMFLMFRLVRPDVLPVGDLGIQKGFRALYRMRTLPTPERMERLARPWRPYRSFGCWYLWRVAEAANR